MSNPITWSEIDGRLSRFLKDPENENAEESHLYNQALRIDSWNQAQRALAQQHTPRQCVTTLTMDTERSAILPDDLIEVWRLYDSDDQIWMQTLDNPEPGAIRYDDDDLPRYWTWGGRLLFEKSYTLSSTALTCYYWGYWPEIEYEEEEDGTYTVTEGNIRLPRWAILPVEHLAAAIVLTPGSIEAARVRTFNMKIDSGVPTDNPLLEAAKDHLWWWASLLAMVSIPTWRHGM
jgi:hypothetical protein